MFKVRQTCITYMWNLKNGKSELVYKTEIESQMWKTVLWLPGGNERRDRLGDGAWHTAQ